jgi:hypothetical protein
MMPEAAKMKDERLKIGVASKKKMPLGIGQG